MTAHPTIAALIAVEERKEKLAVARKFGLIAGSIAGLGNVSRYATNQEEDAAYMSGRDEARQICTAIKEAPCTDTTCTS